MTNTMKVFTIVFIILAFIGGLFIGLNTSKAQAEPYEKIFILTENANPKNVNVQKAFYHATLTNGNTLLESEDGNLWEFDNLNADENDSFVILSDENNNLLGLWQAA